MPNDWPLMLSVEVPELRAVRGAPELHIGWYFPGDEVALLGGWETFGFALDSEVDLLDLIVDVEPAAVAEAIHHWIDIQ